MYAQLITERKRLETFLLRGFLNLPSVLVRSSDEVGFIIRISQTIVPCKDIGHNKRIKMANVRDCECPVSVENDACRRDMTTNLSWGKILAW